MKYIKDEWNLNCNYFRYFQVFPLLFFFFWGIKINLGIFRGLSTFEYFLKGEKSWIVDNRTVTLVNDGGYICRIFYFAWKISCCVKCVSKRMCLVILKYPEISSRKGIRRILLLSSLHPPWYNVGDFPPKKKTIVYWKIFTLTADCLPERLTIIPCILIHKKNNGKSSRILLVQEWTSSSFDVRKLLF